MNNTKYALRANVFGYNDEYYNIYDGSADGRVCGIYATREEAMDAWKKMEHHAVKNKPLGQVQDFIESSTEHMQELDKFVFERCGEHIVNDGYLDEECETTIAKMSVEDVFEFLTKAKLRSYTLVEYQTDAKAKRYVWWLPEKQNYIFSSDELGGSGGVCQAVNIEKLYADNYWVLECIFDECEEDYYHLKGTLDELSHSPEILLTLITTHPDVEYDEEQQYLTLKNIAVFKEVYPLLVNPPIEVREVTLEQILEIEKSYLV